MIRRILPVVLVAANIGLAGLLAYQWVDLDGNVRQFSWQPPEPLAPQPPNVSDEPIVQSAPDLQMFAAIQDRPLFSPSRRPPPPPPAPAPPVPPDPLNALHVYGLFAGQADAGGMLARVEGKVRRIMIGDSVGAWKLKSVQERSATFAGSGGERTIDLLRVAGERAPGPSAAMSSAGGAGAVGGPRPVARPSASAAGDPARNAQIEEARRRINERRAARGLPPAD